MSVVSFHNAPNGILFQHFLTPDIVIIIKLVSKSIAKLCFRDKDGNKRLVPLKFSVLDTTNGNVPVEHNDGEYMLAWMDEYNCFYDGRCCFTIGQPRHWYIIPRSL